MPLENIISLFVFRKQFVCHACESSVRMFEKRNKLSRNYLHQCWIATCGPPLHLLPLLVMGTGEKNGQYPHSSVTLSGVENAHMTGCYRQCYYRRGEQAIMPLASRHSSVTLLDVGSTEVVAMCSLCFHNQGLVWMKEVGNTTSLSTTFWFFEFRAYKWVVMDEESGHMSAMRAPAVFMYSLIGWTEVSNAAFLPHFLFGCTGVVAIHSISFGLGQYK